MLNQNMGGNSWKSSRENLRAFISTRKIAITIPRLAHAQHTFQHNDTIGLHMRRNH